MSRILLSLLCLALLSPLPLRAEVEEQRSTLADQQEVAVTIYNENLALIRDQRKVTLRAGENLLALREVSAGMRPETALLHSLTHPRGCG